MTWKGAHGLVELKLATQVKYRKLKNGVNLHTLIYFITYFVRLFPTLANKELLTETRDVHRKT